MPSALLAIAATHRLYITQGSLVYEGPIAPGAQPSKMLAAIGRPVHELANPADAMFDALTEDPDALTKAAPRSPPLPPPPPPISTSGPRYALSLPGHHFLFQGVRRHLFRAATEGVLPDSVRLSRDKSEPGSISQVEEVLFSFFQEEHRPRNPVEEATLKLLRAGWR